MSKPRHSPGAATTRGKPGRPPSPHPRVKQIQIRATADEWALWGRIGAARSAAAGVRLSQQQVFRWMMAHAAETLGCASAGGAS